MAVTLTIYSLKPRLQALLRPATAHLHAGSITPNQVTVAALPGTDRADRPHDCESRARRGAGAARM